MKIKFTVPQICCKGSYWALNKDFELPTAMTMPDNNVRDSIGGSYREQISYPKSMFINTLFRKNIICYLIYIEIVKCECVHQ